MGKRVGGRRAVRAMLVAAVTPARSDEQIFGSAMGVETLPRGGQEVAESVTLRSGKGAGHCEAVDSVAEDEYRTTATWFPQLRGGAQKYAGQDEDLHLIEKTEQAFRLKVGMEC